MLLPARCFFDAVCRPLAALRDDEPGLLLAPLSQEGAELGPGDVGAGTTVVTDRLVFGLGCPSACRLEAAHPGLQLTVVPFEALESPLELRVRELDHGAELSLGPEQLFAEIFLEPVDTRRECLGEEAHVPAHLLTDHVEVATGVCKGGRDLWVHGRSFLLAARPS